MTGGAVGKMPDWYPYLAAARYLGVAPWDLMIRVIVYGETSWLEWARIAENAEIGAREALSK